MWMEDEKLWMASRTPELKETEILTAARASAAGVAGFCAILRLPFDPRPD
jgi:hypothetical protein